MEKALPELADERGLQLAFRYIDRRERTTSEVRNHLRARDLGDATIEATLRNLTELGTLDDARFARVFTQDKRALEQWGAERIRRDLLARGVERDLIEAALDEEGPEGELERALALLCRRFPRAPHDARDRERALGVLVRKGYETDVALAAIRRYADSTAEH